MGSEEGPYPFFLSRIIGNSLKQCKTPCSLRSSKAAFQKCLSEIQGVIEPDHLYYIQALCCRAETYCPGLGTEREF